MNFKQKARVALSAIAVFAVVGGAYAVKAKRTTDVIYTAPNSTALGTFTVSSSTISTVGALTYATTEFGAPVFRTRITAGL